jgi:hypothetical protein
VKTVLQEENGFINYLIEIGDDVEYSMSFKVYEVNSWETDDKNTPIDEDLYLTGFIKWDGCSHITFGDDTTGEQDGYLHLCGKMYWRRHNEIMASIFELAEKTILKFDKEIAE